MDQTPTKETDTMVVIDIESTGSPSPDDKQTEKLASFTMDRAVKELDEKNNNNKKKKKKKENGKCKKPPRPPKGLSLDAADQKLIKEITEVAMMKRARIERLKRMKEEKASSWSGNLIAIVFTILFCAVIIYQGWQSTTPTVAENLGVKSPTPKE